MNVVECGDGCTVSFIRQYIRSHAARTGRRPVVFIDYLQILQPSEDMQQGRRFLTVREVVDLALVEIRRMAREMRIPIIAISSVNRENYTTPIDYASLKESGNIEFTADFVAGLQPRCMTKDPLFRQKEKTVEKRETLKKERNKTPRQIELSVLKNRFGIAHFSCFYQYYPAFDLFIDDGRSNEKPEEVPHLVTNPFTGETARI